MNQQENSKDWLARLLAIGGSAISIITFYFSFWKPPCVRVGLGPQIYVASKPRIGVLLTLVNDGASEIIITSGDLTLDEGRFTLPLTTAAIQTESWEYDDEGNREKLNSFRFSDFTPFAVKSHDQSSASFWFVAIKGFPLSSGRHKAGIVIQDSKQRRIPMTFEFDLDQTTIDTLYKKKKGEEQAGIEYPVTIATQQGGEYCPLF